MRQAAARMLRAVRIRTHRMYRDEKGATIAFLAVIPVLAGTVAVGIETGQLYRVKRQMQGAADAGALAGAIDRMAGSTGTIVSSARYEVQRNGFTNGTANVVVTVNAPPTSGPNVATPGAVEVIVSKQQNFSLGNVLNSWLGKSTGGFTVTARSVAAQSSTSTTATSTTTDYEGGGCMVALTTAAEQGATFTSFGNFTSDCTIMSNGSATGSGSNASVTMSSFGSASVKVWTRGSFSASGYGSLTPSAASARTNQTSYIVDPYAGLGNPTPGACGFNNYKPSSGTTITLSPNTYCGGLQVSSFSTVIFQPGVYYIANGDLYLTSVNTVSCPDCTGNAGITFVMTQTTGNMNDIGGVMITSQNSVTLSAPKTGAYKGVLFYQDRRVPAGTMTSTSKIFTITSLNTATLWGAIYFPRNRIDISSLNSAGSSTNGCTVWIGRYIKFTSYNSAYVAGCKNASTGEWIAYPGGIETTTTTTTTTAKGKLYE